MTLKNHVTVTKPQEVTAMPATRIEMCDGDGDGVLAIRDDGAEFSGVALDLSNTFGEDVVADLDKHQLLDWCERVAAHLRAQGVTPSAGAAGSYVNKTSQSHAKEQPGVDDLVQSAAS
ncbi:MULTISPECIES: hypothetical protein [Cupriavidus]|uniref:Uncharacterized protein n=1 Tax=Cupriavidus pinatubonensis (strain JMP 134 / LMG 1197) TaxID=264198 RepID=Q46UC4_CUPPJ|nr:MULTISPECIES: hypothetical protein [Cupriavidus]